MEFFFKVRLTTACVKCGITPYIRTNCLECTCFLSRGSASRDQLGAVNNDLATRHFGHNKTLSPLPGTKVRSGSAHGGWGPGLNTPQPCSSAQPLTYRPIGVFPLSHASSPLLFKDFYFIFIFTFYYYFILSYYYYYY